MLWKRKEKGNESKKEVHSIKLFGLTDLKMINESFDQIRKGGGDGILSLHRIYSL